MEYGYKTLNLLKVGARPPSSRFSFHAWQAKDANSFCFIVISSFRGQPAVPATQERRIKSQGETRGIIRINIIRPSMNQLKNEADMIDHHLLTQ
uniref:Uncharacterized protein n=1 Tax=Leersia perrieri TaxID=77586 RepID=A0A0D9VF69_9ORYZ